MQDFKTIYFIREFIKDYASIVALFLSNANPGKYKIINQSKVKKNNLLGLTFFSINSYVYLKRLRKTFPEHEIIVGGIGVYSLYNRILRYANYVYFGEGFDFDEQCILTNKFEKKQVKIQNKINFNNLPIIKNGKNSYYFLIEKGCPYRCEYCFVSWVNVFRKIDDTVFRRKIKAIDRILKNKLITFVGNEGLVKEKNRDLFGLCKANKYDNQSITLRSYLNDFNLYKNQAIVRFGIELPTEELRFKHLPKIKHIKDSELLEAITKKIISPRPMQFFYIWNYVGTTEKDYDEIYNIVKNKHDFLLRLSFTTLEIHPYTKTIHYLPEHISQLQNSESFHTSQTIEKLKRISKVKIYPAKSNAELLKCYLFSYTDLPLKTKVNSHVIDKIILNASKMKKTNKYVNIVKF